MQAGKALTLQVRSLEPEEVVLAEKEAQRLEKVAVSAGPFKS